MSKSAPILYFVQASDGVFWERRAGDMTRAETIKDIRSGQFGDDIARIYEACTEGPIFNDVTEDILRAAGRWDDETDEDCERSDFAEHSTLNHAQQGI